ncbi:MAG: AAA family ATPase [Pseudomonadales bacterium]|jgi:aminoglycoside phosphotransferase family enzyme/predicted kinase
MTGIGEALVTHFETHPARWPFEPCEALTRITTHSAWVLLSENYALKIKKPVNFGFLDFSTLSRRRACCEEELRLNGRFAPDLYQGVVAFRRRGTGFEIVDDPEAGEEIAVLMARFPQAAQLDEQLARDALSADALRAFGGHWAARQADFERAPESGPWGTVDAVQKPVAANFFHLWPKVAYLHDGAARLAALEQQGLEEGAALAPRFRDRLAQGFIREGHGDLHLKNLCLYQDTVQAFDCIDFSPQLRWIDTVSDLAFLFMDLRARGASREAFSLLQGWLDGSGDHDGIAVLPYYVRYRALVRAKVAALDLAQAAPEARQDCITRLEAQVTLAEAPLSRPALVLLQGLSGSGKSYWGQRLGPALGALCLRSDVERKRLLGLAPETRPANAEERAVRYGPEMSERTYGRLLDLAQQHLNSGFAVMVDATFLNADALKRFETLGETLKVPSVLVRCEAPEAVLRERVRARDNAGNDPSDADEAVLRAQLRAKVPLPGAPAVVLTPETTEETALATLEQALGLKGA